MSGGGSSSQKEEEGDGDYWIYRPKGLYDGWRHVPFPTMYDAMQTAVTADVLEIGLIYAAVIIAFSFLIILPGFRKSERVTAFVRIFLALFILASTLLCNFGQEWEVSHLVTKTQYRAGLRGEINATVGIKIGLRSVNITLKGNPTVQEFEHGRVNETIDYNERLSWDNEGWLIGRAGFGPNAGKYNREFREHQRVGSPYPILWIAEYFTIDGEGIRWGRHYLQAGYYAHIMLWTAFALWILALILFNMVLRYGGYVCVMTGLSMLIANIIYATYRNPNQLEIPFEDGHMQFHWGWCFWLSLVTGILCVVLGVLVVLLDEFASSWLVEFFNVDATQDFEEVYLDANEIKDLQRTQKRVVETVPSDPTPGTSSYNIEAVELGDQDRGVIAERTYRKKSVFGARQITRRVRHAPPPLPRVASDGSEDGEDYENASQQAVVKTPEVPRR